MRTARSFAALLLVAVALAPALAQNVRAPYPQLLSEVTSPAIDGGLRDSDAPRPPLTGRDDRVAAFMSSDQRYIRGSIIVKFRGGVAMTSRRAMLRSVNGIETRALPYADFDIVNIDPAADPEVVAAQLERQPDVEFAQARYLVRPQFTPNDPMYARQWNYPAIDMERAWDINPGATSEITVAVLDSGVAYRSALVRYNAIAWRLNGGPIFPSLGAIDVPFAAAPDLGSADRFVAPRDFIWNTTLPLDLNGHGTHVAGTIGQATNNGIGVAGMAFNVRIMPVKILTDLWDLILGAPVLGTDDVAAQGIRYAVDNGAKVLNMSVGRSGPPAPVVQDALAYAVSQGAFVAIAAGNSFEDGNPLERYAQAAQQIEGVVSVGAVGRDLRRAFYSTTGSYVELAAPGGDSRRGGTAGLILQQTYDLNFTATHGEGETTAHYGPPRFDVFAYQYFQGTSMAAPHVAGFAALLMQQGITSPAAIEAIMKRYATDLGASGRDNEYGFGLINPRSALRGMGLVK